MKRNSFFMHALIGFLIVLLAAPAGTIAQGSGANGTFSKEELDQMIAPVALYPDSLLAQILVAATFPNEVVEADQWVRQNEGLQGSKLNEALDRMDWDLSVKALVPFPKVLAMMSDKLEWTKRLGEAFLAQQNDVMDTVQSLRSKAYAQGNLKSTSQQKVVVKGESVLIEPVNPQVIYVPVYNPVVVYGSWWYPAYPPFAYSPFYPSYVYDPYYSGAGIITAGVLGFAAGIAVGSAWNWGWGHWDWHHHNVYVNSYRNININRSGLRLGHIRTTNVNRVVSQRRRAGAAGRTRAQAAGRRVTGTRPTATSVQKRLQRRPTGAQVRQARPGQRGKQPAARSVRGQKMRATPSARSARTVRPDRSRAYQTRGKSSFRPQTGKAVRGGGQAPRGGAKAVRGGAVRGGTVHGGRGVGAQGAGGKHRR